MSNYSANSWKIIPYPFFLKIDASVLKYLNATTSERSLSETKVLSIEFERSMLEKKSKEMTSDVETALQKIARKLIFSTKNKYGGLWDFFRKSVISVNETNDPRRDDCEHLDNFHVDFLSHSISIQLTNFESIECLLALVYRIALSSFVLRISFLPEPKLLNFAARGVYVYFFMFKL